MTERWLTPEMARAEQELAAVIEDAEQGLAAARQLREELAANPPEVTQADADRLARLAAEPGAPPQWRQLADRVNSGALTWRDIAEGNANTDPAVLAAMSVRPSLDDLPVDQMIPRATELLHSTGEPAPHHAGEPAASAKPRPADDPSGEDDDYSAHGILA